MNRNRQFQCVFAAAFATICCCSVSVKVSGAADEKADGKKVEKITFDDHVQPILRAKCFTCHNTNKKSGGLDLTTYTNLIQGGSSGEVVAPGSAEDSYLFSLVSHEAEPKMPPNSEKIAMASLETIRKWIDGGALENSGSKPITKKKVDLSLKSAPTGRPEGPPPMPGPLSREPVLRTAQTTAVTALATSPWAPLVAVAGQKQVFLYHSQSLQLVGVLPFPEGVANVLKFSRNGSLLLAGGGKGGANGKAVVWNVKSGERVIEVGDELDTVLAADISSNHRFIALGGPQRLVRIYSTEDGELLHEIKKHTDWVTAIEFSPDGVLLATGDRNGGMFVWEAFTAREFHTLKGHSASITDVSWRSDSNLLASGSEDASIRLWEMQNGNQVKNWGGHGGGTQSVEFTRDGRIVSCGRDRTAKLWDQNGKALRTFPAFGDVAVNVTHSDESNRTIAGDWTGAIRVWNADGSQVGELSANPLSLKDRFDAIKKSFSDVQANAKAQAAAYQQAKDELKKIEAVIDEANNVIANSKKQIDAEEMKREAARKMLATLAGEIPALTKTIESAQAVVTPLTEAVSRAEEAGKKDADDKPLQNAVAELKKQLERKAAALAEAKKSLEEKKSRQSAAMQQQKESEKRIADAKAAADAAEKRVKEFIPKLKPANEKTAKLKRASAAAAERLAGAEQAQRELQEAIKREETLQQLAQRRTEREKLEAAAAEKQAVAEDRRKKLDAAKANQIEVAKRAAALKDEMDRVADAAKKSAAEKQAAQSAASTLETAVPLLKESLAKLETAAEKVEGDKEIAAAASQLKKALAGQSAELSALQKSAADKADEVARLQKELTGLEKQTAEAAAALKSAVESVKSAEKDAIEADQEFAAAKSEAESAEKKVAELRAEIATKK